MLPLDWPCLWGTSCPFCPTGLGSLTELNLGVRKEHPCLAPGTSHPHYTEEVVVPVMELVPGPTCLQCPALSWAGKPAPMDFALPCAHLHSVPCLGWPASSAEPAWPQMPRPPAAPCLPPPRSIAPSWQPGPAVVPAGLGLPGHRCTNSAGMPRQAAYAPFPLT